MRGKKTAWAILFVLLHWGGTATVFANGTHAPSEESADQIVSSRPDSHAPLGVMADHAHEAGELMFSYRSMGMVMEGIRDGTTPISTEKALHDYAMVPITMRMQMHMFGAMLAPHNRVTFMAMISYRDNSMEMEGAHLHETGGHDHPVGRHSMSTGGFGDLRLSALIPLLNTSNADFLLNAGVSVPTGAIDLKGTHGGSELTVLPYPMQLGSGSFELRSGATFAATRGSWSYGLQGRAAIPLNKNSQDYRLAPTVGSTLWGARRLNDWISVSLRGSFENWGGITSFVEHAEMGTAEDEHDHTAHHSHAAPTASAQTVYMSPTMDPNLQGGTRATLAPGVNVIVPDKFSGILTGQRLAVEFQMPVYQNLDGPQMELDWTLIAGWQYAFELW